MSENVAISLETSESIPFYDRFFLRFLNDRRDLPFVHFAIQATVVIPGAVYLFLPGTMTWWLAAAYLLVWFTVFMDRYILALHCTSHRPLFRPKYKLLNRYIPWVLGPFFGQTPESYLAHHIGMHHQEENLRKDLSSTLKYRRDRFLHWLVYFGDFMVLGYVRLVRYFQQKGKRKMVRHLLIGELGFWAAVTGLLFLNWQATLVVFVFPLLLVRTLMMVGNWAQHSFIDPEDPGNAYGSSITCINTRYNRRCFNDGYHIIHHDQPRKHYSEMPAEFEQNRAAYGRRDAIVFEGIDYFLIWFYLMIGAWGRLARAFVRLPGAPPRTDEEVIAHLKARVQPIGKIS